LQDERFDCAFPRIFLDFAAALARPLREDRLVAFPALFICSPYLFLFFVDFFFVDFFFACVFTCLFADLLAAFFFTKLTTSNVR
jgi:hypothetical protein